MSRVTDLRKSGQLEEAYRLAKNIHADKPSDIWATRDFAWVLYDCMKRFGDEDSRYYRRIDVYVISLRQARGLRLGDDETMFFDWTSKNLKSVVWDLKERGSTALPDLRKLLNEVVQWDPRSPLFLHKTIGYFLKGLESDPSSVVTLMSWWGLDRFTEEDLERREVNDRRILSFAEEATHRYLKALSAKDQHGNLRYDEKFLSDVVETAKGLVADPRCEDWEWPNKSLGDLLMAMGRDDEAVALLASVVLAKPREGWAWHAFGKSLERGDRDAYVSCLYKGLSLSRDTKMALSLHEESMQLFADQGLDQLAKAEAEMIDSCRRENGWSRSEAAARTLLAYRDVDAASPKKLGSEYASRSHGAMECLAAHATRTELYLEWVSPKNRKAGIVTLEEPAQSAWTRPKEPALMRRTVSLAGRPSDFDAAVGEVWDGILDNRQRALLAVLPHQGGDKIRRRVIREAIGALDLVINEKTSKRTCFVRLPASSPRDDDLFVPPSVADGAKDMAGSLVAVVERLVFRRGKDGVGRGDKSNEEGHWSWEVTSVRPAESGTAAPIEQEALTQFYVERLIGDGVARTATLSTQTGLNSSIRLAKPFTRLEAGVLNLRYANAAVEEHRVYQGQVYGSTRQVVIGDVVEIQNGELFHEVIRPTVTGVYEASNGWGHIGCPEGASILPREAQGRSIEPGSIVTARLYKAYIRDSKGYARTASGNPKDGGRWEWYAEDIRSVSPPEHREVKGAVTIAAKGYGFLETDDGLSCFTPKVIIERSHLTSGDHVTATVRRSWDRKRAEDSWIVTQIGSIIHPDGHASSSAPVDSDGSDGGSM